MISATLEWVSQNIFLVIGSSGYFGIFILMALESFNIPMPSEIIMPFAGFLAVKKELLFWWIVVFGSLGNLTGSILNYFFGYFGGRAFLIRFGKYFLVHEKDLMRADNWFKKFGNSVVFFGRMLPVIRTFISLPAGIAEMNFGKFILFTFLGVIPWNIMLTYFGFYLGEKWSILEAWFHKLDWVILVLIMALIAWWIWKHKKVNLKVEN
jgi:membrane protein DedA with SNARE-associated domain